MQMLFRGPSQGAVNRDTLDPDTQHPSKPIFPHCGTNKILHCSISGINPDTSPKSLQNPPKPGHRPQSCTAAIEKCTGAEKSDFAGKGAVSLVFRVLVNLCPGLRGPEDNSLQSTRIIRMRDKDARALGGHVDVFRRCKS